MPINKTGAPLWFKTKEEEVSTFSNFNSLTIYLFIQDAYDDKMISNIELKSLNYDDENFSPVFDRAKQEFFLKPGEKFIESFQKAKKYFLF